MYGFVAFRAFTSLPGLALALRCAAACYRAAMAAVARNSSLGWTLRMRLITDAMLAMPHLLCRSIRFTLGGAKRRHCRSVNAPAPSGADSAPTRSG